jgi:hypothetical protein
MIMLIDKVLLAAVIVLIGLLGVQRWQLYSIRAELVMTQLLMAQERELATARLVLAQEEYRAKERHLTSTVAATQKETRAQIKVFTGQWGALVQRVRVAEAKTLAARTAVSQATADTADGQTASGDDEPELLASIGVTDVDEARRADEIRISLLACYVQYEAARTTLIQ